MRPVAPSPKFGVPERARRRRKLRRRIIVSSKLRKLRSVEREDLRNHIFSDSEAADGLGITFFPIPEVVDELGITFFPIPQVVDELGITFFLIPRLSTA